MSGTFNELMKRQKQYVMTQANDVSNADIRPIAEGIYAYNNSVNIFVGVQGTGKTYTAMQEILKIAQVQPNAHLLLIITEFGQDTFDPTIIGSVKLLEDECKLPVLYVKYTDAVETLQRLLCYKRLYHSIVHDVGVSKVEESQLEEVKQELHIRDFDNETLHTLVLFDDASGNPLFNKGTYLSKLLGICRKIYCSFFLTVQKWQGLSTTIRSNTTTAFITGGFSRQEIAQICRQVASKFDYHEIYDAYRKLSPNDKLIINNRTGNIDIDLAVEDDVAGASDAEGAANTWSDVSDT